MRGRREAPGLRPRGIAPRMQEAPFAFTTLPGLVSPAARVHVRLLGPCFKTGRRGRRPTRDRRTGRDSKGHSLYEPATFQTRRVESQERRARHGRSHDKLHPRPRSRPSDTSRPDGAGEVQPPTEPTLPAGSSRIPSQKGHPAVDLNLRPGLREPLRLPLHSFTYC